MLGGLKTKDVDVVVSKAGIGPCVAVSIKGTLNAFRNLTNRMEEAVGDCTNLHISYPNLVYGFLHVIRANREGPLAPEAAHFLKADDAGNVAANDIALRGDGEVVESIVRYHDVLLGLTGRDGVRNDISRYEALALAMVDPERRAVLADWPLAPKRRFAWRSSWTRSIASTTNATSTPRPSWRRKPRGSLGGQTRPRSRNRSCDSSTRDSQTEAQPVERDSSTMSPEVRPSGLQRCPLLHRIPLLTEFK